MWCLRTWCTVTRTSVRARSCTNSCKRDKLQAPPVYRCVGMATQLGENCRQKTASEKRIRRISVLFMSESEPSEWEWRGWCEVCWSLPSGMFLLKSSLAAWRGSVAMHNSAQATSLTIPKCTITQTGRQKVQLHSSPSISNIIIITNNSSMLLWEERRLDFPAHKNITPCITAPAFPLLPNHAWQRPTG